MTKKLIDVQHPFFIPVWRRVAVVAVCFGWALVEFFSTQSVFWGILFAAAGVYCTHQFFFAFDPKDPKAKADAPPPPTPDPDREDDRP